MSNEYIPARRGLFALFSMLFGGVLMVVLVVSFNKNVEKKEPVVKKEIRQIKSNEHKKTQAAKPKPKPKPKPKAAQPKAPMPNLNSLLGGVSMNIPEFETQNIAGDAKDLLGDIAEDAVMTEGTVDSKPKVLSRAPLEYPSEAAKEGIKGYVIINLLVAKDGTVELAKILESQPAGVFDAVAINSVQSWRFGPAKYKGKPVKVWAKQKIRFD
jgi:protein TonB